MSKTAKGASFLLADTFFMAFMAMFSKLAGPVPTAEKVCIRSFFMLLFVSVTAVARHEIVVAPRQSIVPLLCRAIGGTVSLTCNFYAVDHMNLADATLFNKMSPLFVVLFSALLLKEKPLRIQIGLVIAAFFSSFLVIKPTGNGVQAGAAAIAMLGGITGGFATACVRWSERRGASNYAILFMFSAASFFGLLPAAVANYVPLSRPQFICLVCCGLSAAFGHFCLNKAYSYAQASEISVLDYTQIFFSALLSIIIFSDAPDMLSVLGYLMIIGIGSANTIISRKLRRA